MSTKSTSYKNYLLAVLTAILVFNYLDQFALDVMLEDIETDPDIHIQTLVPENIHASSFALVYLSANLVGMGIGLLAAGMLSDAFRPWAAEESLRYASMALAPGYFWVAWHAWRASNSVKTDIVSISPTPNFT